jgi:large conductance mechanosensitive channel
MLKEFKEFAMRGNVVDMAVGIIIGAAFGTIVSSAVNDVLMPPLGLLIGNVDFSNMYAVLRHGVTEGMKYASLADAQHDGAVVIAFGKFINQIINFIIVAFAVFLMIRSMNKLKKEPAPAPAAPTTKECPYCLAAVPLKATKCGSCTSELKN